MTKIKRIISKIIIIYLISYMILSLIGSAFAETNYTGYNDATGEYLAQYARDYVSTYVKQDASGIYNNAYYTGTCYWSGGDDGQGIWYVCCTTGVQYMYRKALGIELTQYGWSLSSGANIRSIEDENSTLLQYFDVITRESDLKPGDIMCGEGHTEMYVGIREHFNSGSGRSVPSTTSVVKIASRSASLQASGGSFIYGIRLKNAVAVDPSGRVTSTGTIRTMSYARFFFNGIPDGKYSLASKKNIFEMIFETIKEMATFLSQIIGYLIRGFLVGIVSIFDRLINNTVQSLTDAPKSLQETGVSATSADDPYSMNRSITIEGLIFNGIDLFDINIFRVD